MPGNSSDFGPWVVPSWPRCLARPRRIGRSWCSRAPGDVDVLAVLYGSEDGVLAGEGNERGRGQRAVHFDARPGVTQAALVP